MKKVKIKNYLFIHIVFFWYSGVGFFSKNAAAYEFLSLNFIKWYMGVIVVMGVYAILWQQVLKRFSLTIAYANKSIVMMWSVFWGILFWQEKITVGKIAGTLFIIIGIIFVANGEKNEFK